MGGTVRLEYRDSIAVITNDNTEKHNAFDDDMDTQLFDILGELKGRRDVRAVIWRGEGKSWSSGRDVSTIGAHTVPVSHHDLMRRGHEGILQIFDIDAPIIVAIQGWAIGGSFQRALLCDIRVAAEGARFMLPEVGHGVIPDTGGVGRLYEICGPGVVSDLVLTGRVMERGGGARARHRVACRRRRQARRGGAGRWRPRSRRRRRSRSSSPAA